MSFIQQHCPVGKEDLAVADAKNSASNLREILEERMQQRKVGGWNWGLLLDTFAGEASKAFFAKHFMHALLWHLSSIKSSTMIGGAGCITTMEVVQKPRAEQRYTGAGETVTCPRCVSLSNCIHIDLIR